MIFDVRELKELSRCYEFRGFDEPWLSAVRF